MPFVHGEESFPCDGVISAPLAFVGGCEDCLTEAWERMTFGGVNWARDAHEWHIEHMCICLDIALGEHAAR